MSSVSFITDFIQLIAYFLLFNITYFITKLSLDNRTNVYKYPYDIYVRKMSTTNCIHCFLHFQYFRITFFSFSWLTLTLPVYSTAFYPLWRILDKWLSRRYKYLSQEEHYVPSEQLYLTSFKKNGFF